jgi:hypothetical protein
MFAGGMVLKVGLSMRPVALAALIHLSGDADFLQFQLQAALTGVALL